MIRSLTYMRVYLKFPHVFFTNLPFLIADPEMVPSTSLGE